MNNHNQASNPQDSPVMPEGDDHGDHPEPLDSTEWEIELRADHGHNTIAAMEIRFGNPALVYGESDGETD